MKKLYTLAFLLISWLGMFAQSQSPIPKISQQMADFYSSYPKEKVFIITDKQWYRPGETIWFSALATNDKAQLASENQGLMVRLYNSSGKMITGDKFQLVNNFTPGDLKIPDDLSVDHYFLVAYTSAQISPDEVFCTPINIDPIYSDQWVVTFTAKDSISTAGQQNELTIWLRDLSGDIQKNTPMRYQLMNGKEIIGKGKIKTDNSGKAYFPFTLPAKSNGEPFVYKLSDNKGKCVKEIFLPSNLDQIVISFYPEGGPIVTGLLTKIGFTAFNKWGIPVDVEGSVVDPEGKQVAMVKTITKGLGLFAIQNDENQKLKLALSGKIGQAQIFELPDPDLSGLSFSVVKTDPDFISTNLVFTDKQKHTIALVASNRSNLYWAADLDINGMGRIKIPTESLPQGINLLSVFSNDGKILANRLVFIDKKQGLNMEVLPEKNNLKQGESMKIKIRMTDENNQPVSGNISISVADNFRKAETSSQIEGSQLDETELKTPLSLISKASHGSVTNTALMDIFMIANQLKSFSWPEIMEFKHKTALENNIGSNRISGIVTDKTGNKIDKAKVCLVNNKNLQLYTTTTNQDGHFSFPNLNMDNTEDFSTKVNDPEGKRELNINFDKNFEDRIADYITETGIKIRLSGNNLIGNANYFMNNPDLFCKAPKVSNPNTVAQDNQKKLLSTSTNLMDVIKVLKPYNIKNNQIVFVGSENSLYAQGGALIALDGQMLGTDISGIQNISPMEVDHINISTNPMDIQRYTGLNSVGVIEIFSKKAPTLPVSEKAEITNRYNGEYRVPNIFQTEAPNPKLDFRTTLQWIPELKVDETGLTEISVTTGKVLSDFVIEVQGIAINGRMGSGKAKFSVSK